MAHTVFLSPYVHAAFLHVQPASWHTLPGGVHFRLSGDITTFVMSQFAINLCHGCFMLTPLS